MERRNCDSCCYGVKAGEEAERGRCLRLHVRTISAGTEEAVGEG